MTEAATTRDDQVGPAPDSPSGRRAAAHALGVVALYTLLAVLFFSPVLFSEYLIAPGDGMIYFLPNFFARRTLWDAALWGGFPAAGDSQRMTWYPPAVVFSLLGSWHAFMLSAYVLACSFAYGYAHALTRSRLAAAVAGTTYGLGGFIVAHAGHPALVHAAAWTPAVVWSLEMLARERGTRRGTRRGSLWFAAGALAVGCCALAGHPQMFVYAMSLGGGYALARGLTVAGARARLGYYFRCALVAGLGAGLAAVQLVPTAELARLSLRASLDFAGFVSYSLPLRQTPMLLFPYLFGGAPGTFYDRAYFGAWGSEDGGWGAGELSGYAGLLPLVLAAVGFLHSRRRRLAWFWLAAGALALLLAFGDKTPLAWLAYQLPVVNKFRVPARHYMELTLAVAVLAALGVKSLQERAATSALLRRTLLGAAVLVLACLAAVVALTGRIDAWAAGRATRPVSFLPWENPATLVPLLVFAASAAALLFWHARPRSRARRAVLLAALLCDLGSFTWFYEWRYAPPYRAYLVAPPASAPLRVELDRTRQRLLPARGGTGRVAELPPNLSKLWGFPSASGYGPFTLARLGRALSMPPHGSTDAWRDDANRAVDLLAARYLLVPRASVEPARTPGAASREAGDAAHGEAGDAAHGAAGGAAHGAADGATDGAAGGAAEWAGEELNVTLGAGCGAPDRSTFNVALGRPVAATSLNIVSALACSTPLEDGAEFARVTLTDVDGRTRAVALAAGRDSSEWAADCEDVRPQLRHARAPVFRSYPVTRETGARCAGHEYLARLAVPEGMKEITAVRFDWTAKIGVVVLKKLTLADGRDGGGTHAPVLPSAVALADTARWRRVADIDGGGYPPIVKPEDAGAAIVYENLRAMPRTWLVGEVLAVSEAEALDAVRASRLPGGLMFDPARVALVEEPFTLDAATAGDAARAGAAGADAAAGPTDDAGGAGATVGTAGGIAPAGTIERIGTAEVVSLDDDHMEVLTRASASAFLITSDVFYPGWEASVDGRAARVFQTDYLLRGVAVPAGERRVRFEFRPRSFRVGAWVSLASLLLVAACSAALGARARTGSRD